MVFSSQGAQVAFQQFERHHRLEAKPRCLRTNVRRRHPSSLIKLEKGCESELTPCGGSPENPIKRLNDECSEVRSILFVPSYGETKDARLSDIEDGPTHAHSHSIKEGVEETIELFNSTEGTAQPVFCILPHIAAKRRRTFG